MKIVPFFRYSIMKCVTPIYGQGTSQYPNAGFSGNAAYHFANCILPLRSSSGVAVNHISRFLEFIPLDNLIPPRDRAKEIQTRQNGSISSQGGIVDELESSWRFR